MLAIEKIDFSRGNASEEARISTVTTVASICYDNPKAINNLKLYDRLSCESNGLPSSAFEFVPVLVPYERGKYRFGEQISDDLYLTNLREVPNAEYNSTKEETDIIDEHLHTFKLTVDILTARQLVRHRRASYQELSRRYVSNKKHPFTFHNSTESPLVEEHYDNSVKLYEKLIKLGYKPQEARCVIPLGAITIIYTKDPGNTLSNSL